MNVQTILLLALVAGAGYVVMNRQTSAPAATPGTSFSLGLGFNRT